MREKTKTKKYNHKYKDYRNFKQQQYNFQKRKQKDYDDALIIKEVATNILRRNKKYKTK